MDIKTALKNSIPFQLDDSQLEVMAISRGLDLGAEYSRESSVSQSYELTLADMITIVLMTPNVSEGGVSISYNNLGYLRGIANRIYAKYGEALLDEQHPTVKYLEDFI